MKRGEQTESGDTTPFLEETLGRLLDRDMVVVLASGIGPAAIGAAGIWLFDASGLWMIVAIGSLILGVCIARIVLFGYLCLAVVGVGAAVLILPMRGLWALIKAIARAGHKP